MVVTAFTWIVLALGIGILISALVYIIGFVVSAFVGAGVATVDSAVHHGHPHGAV
jgi:hypothetical protein